MNDGYRNLPSINQAGVWGCPGTILPEDALAEIPVTGNQRLSLAAVRERLSTSSPRAAPTQIHGSFFEYFRDGSLSARNYFNTVDQPKNSFTNNQFGGSGAGPIVKDKSFWFLAYEGQREDGGLPQLGSVPTQADIDCPHPGRRTSTR